MSTESNSGVGCLISGILGVLFFVGILALVILALDPIVMDGHISEEASGGIAVVAAGLGTGALLWILDRFGRVLKESGRKREQWKRTLPGLFDTGKRLSKEGVDLFNKKEYERALNTFEESLSKFREAREAAKHDPQLAKSIETNVAGLRTNIIASHIAVGSSISGEAKNQFDGGNPERALETYKKALPYLEKALNDATQIRDDENINRAKNLKEQVKANIEGCLIAMDNTKVEDLFKTANSLFTEALKVKEKRKLYKARDKLKEVHSIIDEAFGLATKRDFTEAKVTLSNLLQQVRGQMNSVYDLIAGGVEEISIEGGVEQVKAGAAPNIPLIEKEVLRKEQEVVTTPSTFPAELQSKYRDVEYISKGGFARVFRANRVSDGRTVALKVPLSLDEATGRSFLKEIKAWEELRHENIIQLYDVNIMPIPYFEMEYADKGNLEALSKPVQAEEAARIIFEILSGLKYTHDKGVIHRDLKPQNVLLTGDLTPKISDWGLSKVVAESKSSSITGFSPLYATPEHVAPKQFGRPDPRTDNYQVGVIFYELVTGRLPFEGDSIMEISSAIVGEEPDLPSEINPGAKDVEPIIMKCLQKRKEDRYQSAAELQRALAGYLKVQLTESLKKSSSSGDLTKSRLFCADLVLLTAKQGDYTEMLKYLSALKGYAKEEDKAQIENVIQGIYHRQKKGIEPGEEEHIREIEILTKRVLMK